MRVLRIKDWDRLYESKGRKAVHMRWVAVPTKQDGFGYSYLIAKMDAAGLGAWLSILQVAAKSKVRGYLLRDDQNADNEYSLAAKTRIRPETIKQALDILTSPEVGWIEEVDIEAHDLQTFDKNLRKKSEICAKNGKNCASTGQDRTVHNSTVHNTLYSPPAVDGVHVQNDHVYPDQDFNRFWDAYPSKVGKKPTYAVWELKRKNKTLASIETILNAIEQQKTWDRWKRGKIANPRTWLNQERWADQRPPESNYISRDEANRRADARATF